MTLPLAASIIVIGDEILGGYVQDTNSGWLAGRLRRAGVPLERIVTVPDDLDEIGGALAAELARPRPRLLLTSGGIGSTPDDRTMEAVARSFGVPLVVDPELDARIDATLARGQAHGIIYEDEQERALRKMTLVPEGARVLPGAEGVAPGAALDVDGGSDAPGGATVVVLPGVPSELRRIVLASVEPQLLEGRGRPQHVQELCHPYPESLLSPLLDRLVLAYPDVHVGSYPGHECVVRLEGPREQVEAATTEVRAALQQLAGDPSANRMRAAWQARWTPVPPREPR